MMNKKPLTSYVLALTDIFMPTTLRVGEWYGNLKSKLKNYRPKVYADYASSTPLAKSAWKAMLKTQLLYANPSGIHTASVLASRALTESRSKIADILNARTHEIYFTGSGTESCNIAIMGVVKAFQKTNPTQVPHVISSPYEHPAVREALNSLSTSGDITISYLTLDKNNLVSLDSLQLLIKPETILVTVMYVQNELGLIMPIKEIGKAIQLYKKLQNRNILHSKTFEYPYFFVDACQAPTCAPLDTFMLGVDLLAINSSKVYGPKGVAALYKKEGVLCEAISYGGGQERGLRSGTQSLLLVSGFAEALIETIKRKPKELIRLEELSSLFRKELSREIPEVLWYSSRENSSPSFINIGLPGMSSDEMIIRLSEMGIYVSHMSSCASDREDSSYVLQAIGKSSTQAAENIRITLGRNTSARDILYIKNCIVQIYNKYHK